MCVLSFLPPFLLPERVGEDDTNGNVRFVPVKTKMIPRGAQSASSDIRGQLKSVCSQA